MCKGLVNIKYSKWLQVNLKREFNKKGKNDAKHFAEKNNLNVQETYEKMLMCITNKGIE